MHRLYEFALEHDVACTAACWIGAWLLLSTDYLNH